MTRTLVLRLLALALAVAVSSCALPRVYKVTIQQGNVITQKMVDELKPGMTREQVAYIMGEPVMRNPFDESRWDYVYTLRVPRSAERQITMSLFFTDDVLSHFTGDLAPSDQQGDAENPDLASSD